MKHLRLFEDETAYEAAKNNIEKPYVALTEDDSKVQYGGGVDPQPTYEMVDLGLPSGLKWAKCNIGAKKETDYGLYFQWGATEGYVDASHSTWETCPFNNGASDYNSEYFASVSGDVCPNGVLAVEYDAATHIMGSQYRLPTKADWDELLANTTNEWITNYEGSGVNGRLFTSKTNGNTLFVPASGYAYGGSMSSVGSYLGVWSSTLNTSSPGYAWTLDGRSSGCDVDNGYRWLGFSLRGVHS